MKKKILLLSLLCSINLFADINKEECNKFEVKALLVKDMNSHKLLYSKEATKRVAPASLTKIITALIAIEKNSLGREVKITREMTRVEPTRAGYRVGDVILMEDLLKAAMIESDNDAAKSIAIAIGGTEAKFVDMMNKKAKKIGMKDTHFTNACGFDNKQHYSTPQDLLKMAEYAIKNDKFNSVSSLNSHKYASLDNKHRAFHANTHNHLLSSYEYAVGIKTGYTSKAGPCLIARAKKGKKDCVIVMMNAKENRWKTAKNIFEQVLES